MRQAKLTGTFDRTGRLRYVVLASPDIDADLFKRQLAPFSAKERRFYVLTSQDGGALRISRLPARGIPRVGSDAIESLAKLGVTVIDLSQIKDSGSSHSKFAESPEIVQLIGLRLSVDGPLETAPQTQPILSSLLTLPIAAANVATGDR